MSRWKYFLTWSTRNHLDLPVAWEELRSSEKRFKNLASKRAYVGPRSEYRYHAWHEVSRWIGVWEIKNNRDGKGYNVHSHMIVETAHKWDRSVYSQFHRDWDLATGIDGSHLSIIPVLSSDAMGYLTKYMAGGKPVFWGGLDQYDVEVNSSFFKGKRMMRRSRGFEIEKPPTEWRLCCMPDSVMTCKFRRDFDPLWDGPY